MGFPNTNSNASVDKWSNLLSKDKMKISGEKQRDSNLIVATRRVT